MQVEGIYKIICNIRFLLTKESREDLSNILGAFLIKQLFHSRLLDMRWLEPTRLYAPRELSIRESKKLRRQLQGKRHIKIELCVKLSLCDYSMLITSYKIGRVHFRLPGTNGFHVKAKNERFTSASSRCRQNLKYENYTSSFGRLRQNKLHQKACRTCSTIIFLHSTNQIIDLWRCRWRCLRQILNSLLSHIQSVLVEYIVK